MWCVHLRGRVGTSVEVVLFGDVSAHIPQVVVMSTSLGALPALCRAPLPGVTPPASPECPTPLSRGWLWGCQWVVTALLTGGRYWCRWGWLFVCSRLWLCSMAEDWVVVLAVVGVVGVGFVEVRRCGRGCWSRVGLSRDLLAPLAPASPVRLRRSVFRHSIGAGCGVVGVLPAGGRGCCR